MGTKTSFLELTLPDNGEYVDTWDSPVNANFEDVDDWASGLHTDLVGTGTTTETLKGGTASLQARLDAGLNNDGTPNLDNSPDFEALTRSEVYPVGASSDQGKKVRQRFNQAEVEVAKLRAATAQDRFGNTDSPEAMTGLAKLAAQYKDISAGVQSPVRGFAPNTVVEGSGTASEPNYLSQGTGPTENETTIKDGTIINIDGFYFEIDGDMTVDLSSKITGITDTYYLYVTRNESDYGNFDLVTLYGNPLGGTYALDQRVIPANTTQRSVSPVAPSTGTIADTALSTLTTTGNSFTSYNVRPGDILRIVSTSNSLQGDYVIKSVVGNDELEIFGEFQLPPTVSTATNVQHYIWRPTTPVLGVRADNSYQAGVVYVGEVDISSGSVTAMRQYAIGGIHDTGWVKCNAAGAFTDSLTDHHLGTVPSQIEVWFRDDPVTRYLLNPPSAIDVQYADEVGGTTWAVTTTPVQGIQITANASQFGLYLINPQTAASYFYDFSGGSPAHVTTSSSDWDIRVILRR